MAVGGLSPLQDSSPDHGNTQAFVAPLLEGGELLCRYNLYPPFVQPWTSDLSGSLRPSQAPYSYRQPLPLLMEAIAIDNC